MENKNGRFPLGGLAGVAVLSAAALSVAQAGAAGSSPVIVELPPVVVSAGTRAATWRHVEVPGLEVLSNCPDRITRDFILAEDRLEQLLALIYPEEFQAKLRAPRLLVLSSREKTPSIEQDIIAGFQQPAAEPRGTARGTARGPVAAPRAQPFPRQPPPPPPVSARGGGVVVMSGGGGSRGGVLPGSFGPESGMPVLRDLPGGLVAGTRGSGPPVRFLSNLRLDDIDYSATFVVLQEAGFDPDRLRISSSQVKALLEGRAPRLPAWFISGFANLYERMSFGPDSVSIGAPRWLSTADQTALAANIDYPRALMSPADFFAVRNPEDRDAVLWQSQAALFIRWGLDTPENGGPGKEALWKFIRQSSAAPVTEDTVRDCFGIGYADLRDRLSDYLPGSAKASITIKGRLFARPPRIALADASDADIARIRGEWDRLALRYVAAHNPEFADRYSDRARTTFAAAVDAGIKAPAFIASLALFELERGEREPARAHLEAAVAAGVPRPRTNVELARIRYGEALSRPEGGGRLLGAAQVRTILAPLAAGQAYDPPIRAAYELTAEAWARSEAALTGADFTLLESGMRYYPDSIPLLYFSAVLRGRQQFTAESRALIERGLRIEGLSPEQRDAFEKLRAALPAP